MGGSVDASYSFLLLQIHNLGGNDESLPPSANHPTENNIINLELDYGIVYC